MKYRNAVSLTVILALSSPVSFAIGPNLEHPVDDILHAAGGALAVEVVKPKTYAGAIALTAGIGVAKELTDKNFDNRDVLTWVVGGVLYQKYRLSVETTDSGDGVVLSKKWEF